MRASVPSVEFPRYNLLPGVRSKPFVVDRDRRSKERKAFLSIRAEGTVAAQTVQRLYRLISGAHQSQSGTPPLQLQLHLYLQRPRPRQRQLQLQLQLLLLLAVLSHSLYFGSLGRAGESGLRFKSIVNQMEATRRGFFSRMDILVEKYTNVPPRKK